MLESALRTWRQWRLPLSEQPVVLKQLGGGKTNRCYLIGCLGSSFDKYEEMAVVRINHPHSEELGINRRHEKIILEQVAAAGVAPVVYFCDPERGVLVTEYLEGPCWTSADFQSAANRGRLIKLLEKVHSLPVDLPVFDYYRHVEYYWQLLLRLGKPISRQLQQQREAILPLLVEFQNQSTERVLCHHDSVPANIVESGGELKLLDWEYAGKGLADFDWAIVAAEGQRQGGPQHKRNSVACQVYRYVCTLWQALRETV